MATKKKAVKKAAAAKTDGRFKLFTIEKGIDIPPRGLHDPEFFELAKNMLTSIKIKESFVLPAKKVNAFKKIAKEQFAQYQLRVSVIQPDKKFARIWRLK